MYDFHILSLCIQNKDVAGAMRVLRDKSEFAARKILEKIKVTVTSLTGRAFWHDVQRWLLNACRQESIPNESVRSRPSSPPSDTRPAQSGRPGYGQASGAPGHADRPHQYGVYDPSSAGDVCAWPDGIPPVHAYLGDERAARTRTSSGESKPSVDMGHHHPARLQPGLCRPSAVVGSEHSLRVLAIMIWPLSPASYGLTGVALAIGMVITTGGQKPGVQLTGIIVSVLALCCLNGLSHLLSLPADTLLFATLPTLVFPLMALSLSIHLCPEGCPRFMPRHFFYIAYIGHLLVLLLLLHLW